MWMCVWCGCVLGVDVDVCGVWMWSLSPPLSPVCVGCGCVRVWMCVGCGCGASHLHCVLGSGGSGHGGGRLDGAAAHLVLGLPAPEGEGLLPAPQRLLKQLHACETRRAEDPFDHFFSFCVLVFKSSSLGECHAPRRVQSVSPQLQGLNYVILIAEEIYFVQINVDATGSN